MTKLTVTQASKRGYASSLSILQAVQKNWLTAEKDADGQLLVDPADLERLFGRPADPVRYSEQPTGSVNSSMDGSAVASENYNDEDIQSAEPAPSPDPANSSEEASDERASVNAEPGPAAAGNVTDAPADQIRTAGGFADTDESALRDEVDHLRKALAIERRRNAALLDVLADHVLPPAEPNASDAAASTGDDEHPAVDPVTAPPTSSEATASGTAALTTDDINTTTTDFVGPTDPQSPDTVSDPDNQFDENADDAESVELEGDQIKNDAGEDSTIEDDDIAVPDLSVDPLARPAQIALPSNPHGTRATTAQPFIWQLWSLVAFVWVGLIGAFFWYFSDLGGDLWTIAEWLRGERTNDTPEFATAVQSALRAARDIFGPPGLLFILLLVIRTVVRAIRR